MKKNDLILQVNEKPKKKSLWALLSIQHVFAMFGATILVPMLTGLPISVALFSSGIGTLIYIACTKGKVPVYLGSSFAYIGVIVAVSGYNAVTNPNADYSAALTGLVGVGVVYIVVALIIRLVGSKWLTKLLPPVVVGPMIAVIGLSLSSTAIANAGFVLQNGVNSGGVAGSYFDWRLILISSTAFLTTAIIALRGKGFLKIVPFLVGIISGYVMAILVNFLPVPEFGKAIFDFSPMIEVIKNPGLWFQLPQFNIMWFQEGSLGNINFYTMNLTAMATIVPLAFVTICEHIGDHTVLGKITGENYLENPGLKNTLMGDGIATAVAGLIGGPANTTYGENTAVVGMTKIASVWVIGTAAIIAILLSFVNLFTMFIATIPSAVMGGVCIILYGFIASNGLKVLNESKINFADSRNLLIIATILVIGLGNAVVSFGGNFQIFGMSLAALVGILLNQFLPHAKDESTILSSK